MTHWTQEIKKTVSDAIVGARVLFVDLYDSNSRTPNNLLDIIDNYDIMIGYSKKYSVYVAWNAYLHRGRNSASACVGGNVAEKGYYIRTVQLNDGEQGYEKQVVFAPEFLMTFCSNWIFYLLPTVADKKGYDIKLMWADREHPLPTEIQDFEEHEFAKIDRPVYIHYSYERDALFRKRVLEEYEGMCAICHCKVESVLEAHHIIYVSDNGSDKLHNGICLCRNHHKMVHSKLIVLCVNENTYEVDDSITEDPLTKWAIDEYQKHLIVPLSRR